MCICAQAQLSHKMGKKSKTATNLGRSLIKDRFGHGSHTRKTVDNDSMLHTTELQDGYDWGRLNLQSVTEESSFQEFLRTAELAGTEFQAEKLNISFVNPKSNAGLLTRNEEMEIMKKQTDKKNLLKIPRRPKWSVDTTAHDLEINEKNAFLEWRRGLAMLQEEDGMLLTPYEKNLEFWRQLWRVIERSDVIVQIVDARNPLQFRSEDLESYVKESDPNKLNVILINKADFLTDRQREIWAEYFDKENVCVVFFSALLANEELKAIKEAEENKQQENAEESSDDDESCDEEELEEKKPLSMGEVKKSVDEIKDFCEKTEQIMDKLEAKLGIKSNNDSSDKNSAKILTREELLEFFKALYKGPRVTEGVTTIGLVGYPNVGKSSTINALITVKKVSVSATPGKTKHFQTLFCDNDLLLCDCPGLVMPSFVLTKADMILNGILPIDQMRDHVPPINLVCSQIPRHILEDKYGIMIAKPLENEDPNRPPYSEELLLSYGFNRGYMTSNGQPDQSRSSRYVLKDYVNGRLLYCHAPPTVPQSEFHTFPERIRHEVEVNKLPPREQRAIRVATATSSQDLDKQFFQQNSNMAKIKGRTHFPHIRLAQISDNTDGSGISSGASIAGSTQSINMFGEKPWKRQKKEKREKLRKKYVHLDQH